MHRDHPRFVLGIFGGGQGGGKTTYATKFLSHVKSACVFCFDPEGQFADDMKVAPARTLYELDAAVPTGYVCFDPHTLYFGDMARALDFFCRWALKVSCRLPGRKILAIDELGMICPVSKIPPILQAIVQSGGRVARLDCVFIAQQPNELHNTIRSQLTEVVCFQLIDDTALNFPKQFGFDPEQLRTLPRFRYVCRNKRGGQSEG